MQVLLAISSFLSYLMSTSTLTHQERFSALSCRFVPQGSHSRLTPDHKDVREHCLKKFVSSRVAGCTLFSLYKFFFSALAPL